MTNTRLFANAKLFTAIKETIVRDEYDKIVARIMAMYGFLWKFRSGRKSVFSKFYIIHTTYIVLRTITI